jgi:hypothetical protein
VIVEPSRKRALCAAARRSDGHERELRAGGKSSVPAEFFTFRPFLFKVRCWRCDQEKELLDTRHLT